MIPVVGGRFPIIAAHRGGGDEVPENTLQAFHHARSLGIKHLETDVYLSADGQVVMHHDPQILDHGVPKLIGALTYQQILDNTRHAPVPLLSDALEQLPDVWWNIDSKVPEVVDPLLGVLRAHDAYGRVLLASFDEKRLRYIRSLHIDQLSTSLGTSAVARLVAASQTATNPATWNVPGPRHGVRAVQVPQTFGPITVITPRFVATCHRYGLAVHAWTINTVSDMERLLNMGVDQLITDRPTLFQGVLQAQGRWREQPGAR